VAAPIQMRSATPLELTLPSPFTNGRAAKRGFRTCARHTHLAQSAKLLQGLLMTEADLHSFMVRFKLGVLSTVAETGSPQSALVGIAVTPSLEIIFDTVKSSRKYPNLIARQRCSFVIGWAGEQTVQYEGEARELSGQELRRCQDVYFRVWPDGPARLAWPGIVYFVVRPRWIRYSDFDQTPPLIREFTFANSMQEPE